MSEKIVADVIETAEKISMSTPKKVVIAAATVLIGTGVFLIWARSKKNKLETVEVEEIDIALPKA